MTADPTEARVEAFVREWIDVPPSRPAEAYAALLALVRQEREDARREENEACAREAENEDHDPHWDQAIARRIRARLAAPQRAQERGDG